MEPKILKPDVIIADTSSLSALVDVHQLDLLKKMYNEVIITPDVKDEYLKKDGRILPDWIKVKKPNNSKKVQELFKIFKGLGESSSIVLAKENPNSLLIIDDDKPKEYARDVENINVKGTLGVISDAYDKGIIKDKDEAKDIINDIITKTLWTSEKIKDEIDKQINDIAENKK